MGSQQEVSKPELTGKNYLKKWEWIDDPAIMEKDVVIFLVCIGFILLVTVVGVIVTIFYFKMIRRQRLIREALQQQEQLHFNENVMYQKPIDNQQEGEDVISECLTCSMIKMGSSVSYSDDRCPQCGASTTKTFLC